jgi:peptide/nickel transport system permease protein
VVPLIGLGMPSFWLDHADLFLSLKWPFSVGGYARASYMKSMFCLADCRSGHLAAPTRAPSRQHVERAGVRVRDDRGRRGCRAPRPDAPRAAERHHSDVTVLGINIGFLIVNAGRRNVFALPGIGSLMLTAIFNRDFPVVQGVTRSSPHGDFGESADRRSYALLDPRVGSTDGESSRDARTPGRARRPLSRYPWAPVSGLAS